VCQNYVIGFAECISWNWSSWRLLATETGDGANFLRLNDASAPKRRPGYVLIVEDELLVRMIVSDVLRDAGYSVIEAASGDEAAEILSSGVPVDLVFSDVRMPGALDGIALLGFVRSILPNVPVVITSGHLQAGLAMTDGATRFLAKPYRVEQVLRLVDDELARD